MNGWMINNEDLLVDYDSILSMEWDLPSKSYYFFPLPPVIHISMRKK
jgi:hypothetical protein